jgi:hemerythrin-like domain-containing protein
VTRRGPGWPALSRRALLFGAGAGLALGAGGAEIANVLAGGSPDPSGVVAPGEMLMEEHGVLKRVLLIYQEAVSRLAGGQEPPVAAIHDGAMIIHDFIEAFHEALEEGYIFPTLRKAGQLVSTVDTLLIQHGRGRQITQLLLSDAATTTLANEAGRARVGSALASFVRMYQPHEAREDTVVFPAYRALIDPAELNHTGNTFAELQRQQFGANGFGEMVNQVAAIEQSLGIYDLDQFTPPPVT